MISLGQRTNRKNPVTVNIFSNNHLTLDGKPTFWIILIGAALLVALVVSEKDPKALIDTIRSFIEALVR